MADKKTIEIKIVNDNAINSLTSTPRDFASFAKNTSDYARSTNTKDLERIVTNLAKQISLMGTGAANRTTSFGTPNYQFNRAQEILTARMENADFSTSSYRGYDESKRTKTQIRDAQRYGVDLFRNPNLGNGFTTDYFRRQSWSNKFPNRNEPNILGLPAPESTSMAIWRGNSLATRGTGMRRSAYTADWILSGQNKSQSNTQSNQHGFTYSDAQYTESGANAGAQTIFDWINKIFSKAGSKIDSMMGKPGFASIGKNGKSVWNEGTGLAGAYSNPRNQALMRGAMIGSIANTAGSFAGNYGNYISSRANVTGSFAGNYYAGTANENYGNYLGGLVNARSQFLQSQVRAGVSGAGQLAGAALLPALGVEGLVGKLAAGAGLGSLAGGLGNLGSAEINQYLQVAGAAFQQKATNLGNASVASQYFGISRWGGNSIQTGAIPAALTMNGKGIDLMMNKTLQGGFIDKNKQYQSYQDQPYFNQLSAFMQNSNVNPANLTNIDANFTKLRSLGYTDTASAAKLGMMSNIYGAVTGNYNGAGEELINQLGSGIGAYGNNYNLDTQLNSVRFQNIFGNNIDSKLSQNIAMRNQYFPEVGGAFNNATNSTFVQAFTRTLLWNKLGGKGNLQAIYQQKEPLQQSDITRIQGLETLGIDKIKNGKDLAFSQFFGDQFSTLLALGAADKLSIAKTTGKIGGAKAGGDTAATSTYESVMSTPNMTVNATNVTLNWALGEAAPAGQISSQFSGRNAPNDKPTNLGGMGISLSPKVVQSHATTNVKKNLK